MMALPERVERQLEALKTGFKIAMPWRVREERSQFDATFERVSIGGTVLGEVTQKGTTYEHCVATGKRCAPAESDSLADAFADVDSVLELEGWELIGRVQWQ